VASVEVVADMEIDDTESSLGDWKKVVPALSEKIKELRGILGKTSLKEQKRATLSPG